MAHHATCTRVRRAAAPWAGPTVFAVMAGVIGLAGCGSTSEPSTAESVPSSPAPGTLSAPPSGAATGALALRKTSLGPILTTKAGMTVYVYDKDTPGAATSACTGGCLGLWPPVVVSTEAAPVPGLSGTLASIAAPGGGRQLTLDGWPLYTYAGDSAPGDVAGQGLNGIWWVVGPTGQKQTGADSGAGEPDRSTY